jgi:hypothetical protein
VIRAALNSVKPVQFQSFAVFALLRGSVVLAVSAGQQTPEPQEIARNAKKDSSYGVVSFERGPV